ncbi:hypothetical protein KBD69_05070 [Candidatus Woesebacteria bacterium]|nr:hypothetical protein [Candidatus Woesebacteria bacterium]
MTKTTKATKEKSVFTKTSDGSIEFELTIPKADLDHAYQETVAEYAARVTVPGFRKGKAPAAMVEKSLDKAELLAHSLEHAFPKVYGEFIQKNELLPLVDPEVSPKSMKPGEDWVMLVKTATFPELTLGDYEKKLKAIKTFKDDKDKLPEYFDTLLENIKFEVSPTLVMAETKAAVQRLAKQLSALKLTVEDYAKSIKKTLDELVKDYEGTARTNLQLEFILYEIGKSQGFKPEERQATLDFLRKL